VTPEDAFAFLDSHIRRGIAPGLERMEAAMALLGDPQRTCPVVHVTGTNGKTTVARVAAAILQASGLKVGLYTSPHLSSVCERIGVDGVPISPEDFAAAAEYLQPYLEEVERRCGSHPTYFEICTILAFQHFADEACDAAVIEVGLGGTWDATNVVDGAVAVVTNVSVDHAEYLGEDPAGIAAEKAGIVKRGATALTGIEDPLLLAVLERRCRDVGAEALWRLGSQVRLEGVRPALGGFVCDVITPQAVHREILVPLLGEFQATNVALGVGAAEALAGPASEEVLASALDSLTSPGRLEVVAQNPLTVLDGAHNPAGVAAVLATLRDTFHFDRLLVVCGVLGDKDLDGIIAPLAAAADAFWATEPAQPRAAPATGVADVAERHGASPIEEPDVTAAVEDAREEADKSDLVLVTGSLTTVAEAREALLGPH